MCEPGRIPEFRNSRSPPLIFPPGCRALVTETGVKGSAATPELARKREQLKAVKRWFHHDWWRIEPKLRTSIVEGISVFIVPVRLSSARPKSATTHF
jgi:hypothetical protein